MDMKTLYLHDLMNLNYEVNDRRMVIWENKPRGM